MGKSGDGAAVYKAFFQVKQLLDGLEFLPFLANSVQDYTIIIVGDVV